LESVDQNRLKGTNGYREPTRETQTAEPSGISWVDEIIRTGEKAHRCGSQGALRVPETPFLLEEIRRSTDRPRCAEDEHPSRTGYRKADRNVLWCFAAHKTYRAAFDMQVFATHRSCGPSIVC
jgi:hypothetical protein